jgi:hypothetical protein
VKLARTITFLSFQIGQLYLVCGWMTIRRCRYYLRNNYLTLRSKVKVPRRSSRYTDTPPYGHAPTYQISLTYLERQKYYGPDKKIQFKKQFFDLEVKGQIFGMWVHDHKAVCRCTVMTFVGLWPLTSRSNNCFLNSIYLVCGSMTIRWCHIPKWPLWDLDLWPQGQIIVF